VGDEDEGPLAALHVHRGMETALLSEHNLGDGGVGSDENQPEILVGAGLERLPDPVLGRTAALAPSVMAPSWPGTRMPGSTSLAKGLAQRQHGAHLRRAPSRSTKYSQSAMPKTVCRRKLRPNERSTTASDEVQPGSSESPLD